MYCTWEDKKASFPYSGSFSSNGRAEAVEQGAGKTRLCRLTVGWGGIKKTS